MSETAFICPVEWKLTRQQARAFEAIYDAPECISRAALLDRIAPYAEPKIIDVVLCHIRRKLARFNIPVLTIWGKGLLIEEDVKAQLRAGAISIPQARAAA